MNSQAMIQTQTTATAPLKSLMLSPNNVRKQKPSQRYIKALAKSIAAQGLLQNIVCEKIGNKFGVLAGGCRYDALQLLLSQKKITRDFQVEYKLTAESNTAVSLSENIHRAPMNAVDEFESYLAMRDVDGLTESEIAALFSRTVRYVKQRLQLASIHPKIREAGRTGKLSIDCLSAFTVTNDQDKQLSAWTALKHQHPSAYAIRRGLTAQAAPSTSRLAQFVGLATYQKAGGTVSVDLFENTQYLDDRSMLDTLTQTKLATLAAQQTGWQWVEYSAEPCPDMLQKCAYVSRIEGPKTQKLKNQLATLEKDYEALEAIEDKTPQQTARLDKMETKLDQLDEAIENSLMIAAKDKAKSGCILAIDHEDKLALHEGLIHPDEINKQQAQKKKQDSASHEDENAKMTEEFSQVLCRNLAARRLAIDKHYLAQQYTVAFDLMLYQLVADLDRTGRHSAVFSARFDNTFIDSSREDVANSAIHGQTIKAVANVLSALPTAKEPVILYKAIKALSQKKKQTIFFKQPITLDDTR